MSIRESGNEPSSGNFGPDLSDLEIAHQSPTAAARIVIVHDDPVLRQAIQRNLFDQDVSWFGDSMSAWSALDQAEPIQLLVTRLVFPESAPHGVALARKARAHQPALKILFVASVAERHLRDETEGLGHFIEAAAGVLEIVDAARRLLETGRMA